MFDRDERMRDFELLQQLYADRFCGFVVDPKDDLSAIGDVFCTL